MRCSLMILVLFLAACGSTASEVRTEPLTTSTVGDPMRLAVLSEPNMAYVGIRYRVPAVPTIEQSAYVDHDSCGWTAWIPNTAHDVIVDVRLVQAERSFDCPKLTIYRSPGELMMTYKVRPVLGGCEYSIM